MFCSMLLGFDAEVKGKENICPFLLLLYSACSLFPCYLLRSFVFSVLFIIKCETHSLSHVLWLTFKPQPLSQPLLIWTWLIPPPVPQPFVACLKLPHHLVQLPPPTYHSNLTLCQPPVPLLHSLFPSSFTRKLLFHHVKGQKKHDIT